MVHPFRRPATAADVGVPLGLLAAHGLLSAAITFLETSGLRSLEPAPQRPAGVLALVVHALASPLARDFVLAAVPLAAVARNAGLSGRSALRACAIALAASWLALGYVAPLAERAHGTTIPLAANELPPYPARPSTWTTHELVVTAVTGRAPGGSEPADWQRQAAAARWDEHGNAAAVAVALALLVVPARRARLPWWLLPFLVAAQVATSGLVFRLVAAEAPLGVAAGMIASVAAGLGAVVVVVRVLDHAAGVPVEAARRAARPAAAWAVATGLLAAAAGTVSVLVRTPGGVAAVGRRVDVGSPAPAFALESLDGARVTSDALRGQVVVVANWATWCGPCQVELPFLAELERSHAARGLRVLAVNRFEADPLVRHHLDAAGLALAAWRCTPDFAEDYPGEALPSTFVIDRAGILRHAHEGFGPARADQLTREVTALLEAPAP